MIRCTRYNNMESTLSLTYDRSMIFSVTITLCIFSISIISEDLHSGVSNASFKLVLNETDEVKYMTEVLVKNEVRY